MDFSWRVWMLSSSLKQHKYSCFDEERCSMIYELFQHAERSNRPMIYSELRNTWGRFVQRNRLLQLAGVRWKKLEEDALCSVVRIIRVMQVLLWKNVCILKIVRSPGPRQRASPYRYKGHEHHRIMLIPTWYHVSWTCIFADRIVWFICQHGGDVGAVS